MSNTSDELDDRIDRLLNEGDELLNEDRPDEAIALYVTAWELLPSQGRASPTPCTCWRRWGTLASIDGSSPPVETPS